MSEKKVEIDVSGLRAGSSAAYRKLLRDFGPASLRIAQQYSGNSDDARDIVQETIIKVMNNIETLKNGRPFAPWYFRILTNTCKDWKKNFFRRFRSMLASDIEENSEIPDKPSGLTEEIRMLIRQMPRKVRMVFILHYQEEFPVTEIGEILQISQNTVRVQLMTGRKIIREKLEGKI